MKMIMKLFDKLEETLIVLCLGFMTVMNFINVVCRYLFTNSFSFTEELTIIAFVWISMLGIAAGYKRYAHLGMSYVVEKFPRKGQAVFALFSMFCSLAAIIILIVLGFEMVQGQIQLNSKTPALHLPSSVEGAAMPIGGIFIVIRILQAGVLEFIKLWKRADFEKEGEGSQC